MKKAYTMLLAMVIMGLTVCTTQAHQRIATQFIMNDNETSAIATIKIPLKVNKDEPTKIEICFEREHSPEIPVVELVLTFAIDFEQSTLELVNQDECFKKFIEKLEIQIGRVLTAEELKQVTQHIEECATSVVLPTIEANTDPDAQEYRQFVRAAKDIPVQLYRLGSSIIIIFWHAGKFVVKCIRQYGPGVWENICEYTVRTKENAIALAGKIRERLTEEQQVAEREVGPARALATEEHA